jgi:ribosomal protein L37AE/L43A
MTLPRRLYSDPAYVLEKKEEISCKGCVFEQVSYRNDRTVWLCRKTDHKGVALEHGLRCNSYTERA